MTPTRAERYAKISGRAGIVCSCCMIVFFLGLVSFQIYPDNPPRFLGIVCGTSIIGALISGVVCIAAAIFGRRKPSEMIKESHEKDVA